MKYSAMLTMMTTSLALMACNEEVEEPDTAYEQQLPAPVPEGGDGIASVPDNDSIEDGPDERIDDQYAGDAQLPDPQETID
jgi:hypothetical protein